MSFADPNKPYDDDPDNREHELDEYMAKLDRLFDVTPANELGGTDEHRSNDSVEDHDDSRST